MKFNNKKVLIVPLDWGLGHATRCVPLIKFFLNQNWEVIIAADGAIEYLLRQEFPQLRFLKLSGYKVKYSKSKWMLSVKIAWQIPKILNAIKKENNWLNKVIDEQKIDLVISDNRYGLYNEKVPCVFLTHQLNIKAPFVWIEKKLQKLNWDYISRFTECWVPDSEVNGLAGELSHPKELHPFPLRYIGPLSRFKRIMAPIKYKYLFLISGPEPQRTLLEKKIFQGAAALKDDVLIVRGKPGDNSSHSFASNITVVDHLEGVELEKAMNSAEYIISRSGYTTVMEVASLQKRAVFIPTPGQTEQEYIALHLLKKGFAFSVQQKSFEVNKTLFLAQQFYYRDYPILMNNMEEALREFLLKYFEAQNQNTVAC